MRISNAKVFIGGQFVDGGIDFDERIRQVGAEVSGGTDAGGAYIIPGLVDIHSHAAKGEDASDGKPGGLTVMSRYYASRGVTSWCPTTMTLPESELIQAMKTIRDFVRPADGAKLAGVNLEGPFLSREKRGAQAAEHLKNPDIELFHRLNEGSGGQVRLITVAPEKPGAMAFIKEASRCCTVSVGHTTADYETAARAFQAGARHVTHLYNAMLPLHHRAPGVIAAAADAGATVELIADGLHVHPAVVRLTYRIFGDRLTLISDSMRSAGMPDGIYTLGGQDVVLKNGICTLVGTDTLAGSCIHLMDAVQKSVSFGVSLEAAVTAATRTPARVIGLDGEIGSLESGKCADLVVLDIHLRPKAVFINGRRVTDI